MGSRRDSSWGPSGTGMHNGRISAPNISRPRQHPSCSAYWWTKERDRKLLYVMEKYNDFFKACRVLGIPEGQRGWAAGRLKTLRRNQIKAQRHQTGTSAKMKWMMHDPDIITHEHFPCGDGAFFDACRDNRGNSWVYSAQTGLFASVANFDEAKRLCALLAKEHEQQETNMESQKGADATASEA